MDGDLVERVSGTGFRLVGGTIVFLRGADSEGPAGNGHLGPGFGLCHPEKGGPELDGTLSVPYGKDALLYGKFGQTVLPLFRMRCRGRRHRFLDEDGWPDLSAGYQGVRRAIGDRGHFPALR